MKTQESIKTDLSKLEKSLIIFLRPSFLYITNPDEDNDIQILVATRQFNQKSVQERIIIVFGIIKQNCPQILEDRLIIVQAYSPPEMDDILEYVFNNEEETI